MQPDAERADILGILHLDRFVEKPDDRSRGLASLKRRAGQRHGSAKVDHDLHISVGQNRRRWHRSAIAGDAPERQDGSGQGSRRRPLAIIDIHPLDLSNMDATSLAILRCRVSGVFASSIAPTCLRLRPKGRRITATLLRHVWPLIVTVIGGRAPEWSASTTPFGISTPVALPEGMTLASNFMC